MLDNKKLNRSSNDRRALGLGNTWQFDANTTNAVNLDVIWLLAEQGVDGGNGMTQELEKSLAVDSSALAQSRSLRDLSLTNRCILSCRSVDHPSQLSWVCSFTPG